MVSVVSSSVEYLVFNAVCCSRKRKTLLSSETESDEIKTKRLNQSDNLQLSGSSALIHHQKPLLVLHTAIWSTDTIKYVPPHSEDDGKLITHKIIPNFAVNKTDSMSCFYYDFCLCWTSAIGSVFHRFHQIPMQDQNENHLFSLSVILTFFLLV